MDPNPLKRFYINDINITLSILRLCFFVGFPQMGHSSEESVEPEAWVNAFLGRIFWDFLGEKYWANVISKKIQMKLSKIRVRGGAGLPEGLATVYQCDRLK